LLLLKIFESSAITLVSLTHGFNKIIKYQGFDRATQYPHFTDSFEAALAICPIILALTAIARNAMYISLSIFLYMFTEISFDKDEMQTLAVKLD